MKIPLINKKFYGILSILCEMQRQGGYCQIKSICRLLNLPYHMYRYDIEKLKGYTVTSKNGLGGGYIYIGLNHTIGDVLTKLDMLEEVNDGIYNERLLTQFKRIMRTTIADYADMET